MLLTGWGVRTGKIFATARPKTVNNIYIYILLFIAAVVSLPTFGDSWRNLVKEKKTNQNTFVF